MNKYLIAIILLCGASIASAENYQTVQGDKLKVKISKSGLNRISNWPYQIMQVTGDDATFRLKADEDGRNVYLMPLKGIGEMIEISIKNNAGFVQDLELEVAAIKGQSIQIDTISKVDVSLKSQNRDLRLMLKAMESFEVDKFYVQNTNKPLDKVNNLSVTQTKLYKWQDLVGGVFAITNKTRSEQFLDIAGFVKRFDNVLTSYVSRENLAPKQTGHIFIIQKIRE